MVGFWAPRARAGGQDERKAAGTCRTRSFRRTSHVNPLPSIWQEYTDPEFRDRAPRTEIRGEYEVMIFEGEESKHSLISTAAGRKYEDYESDSKSFEDGRARRLRRRGAHRRSRRRQRRCRSAVRRRPHLQDPRPPPAVRHDAGLQRLAGRLLRRGTRPGSSASRKFRPGTPSWRRPRQSAPATRD